MPRRRLHAGGELQAVALPRLESIHSEPAPGTHGQEHPPPQKEGAAGHLGAHGTEAEARNRGGNLKSAKVLPTRCQQTRRHVGRRPAPQEAPSPGPRPTPQRGHPNLEILAEAEELKETRLQLRNLRAHQDDGQNWQDPEVVPWDHPEAGGPQDS